MEYRRRSQRELIRDEAAQWVVRLSEASCDQATRFAFEDWRDVDPARDAAFEREAAVWQALDRLRALKSAGSEPDPDILMSMKKKLS
jgi:ferric-dicitrate binding protein FerR (iron transport regulator)